MSAISKASAQQRAGRAGRTKPGKCFRLYTGEPGEEGGVGQETEEVVGQRWVGQERGMFLFEEILDCLNYHVKRTYF